MAAVTTESEQMVRSRRRGAFPLECSGRAMSDAATSLAGEARQVLAFLARAYHLWRLATAGGLQGVSFGAWQVCSSCISAPPLLLPLLPPPLPLPLLSPP